MSKLSQWQKPEYQRAHMHDAAFNGYVCEYNPSGQTVSAHGIFKLPRYTNADVGRIVLVAWGSGATNQRLAVGVRSNDHSDVASRNKLTLSATNSTGTLILRVMSNIDVCDDRYHSFQVSWDATTASLIFLVDMLPVEDASWANRILTTGTMSAVASSLFMIGMSALDNTAAHWIGELGFIGQRSGYYVPDWSVFFHPNGQPKRLDMVTWTEWVVQPGIMHPYADFEGNLGTAAFRRVGNVIPLVEKRALRSTKDGVQNTGGIVFALTNPRTTKVVTYEDSFPQIMGAGGAITRTAVTIDANGFAYLAGSYAVPLRVTTLPTKVSTVRLYQMVWRWENVAPTNGYGLALLFNYQDVSNYWSLYMSWSSSGYWWIDLAQYIAGVYTNRRTFALTGVNYPAHFVASVYDAGDNINAFVSAYEVDVPANKFATYMNYTVASRPLKTATGVAVMNNTDPGINARFRSVLVMDL